MKIVKLSDFLDNEYLEYAIYTVKNRAIPSLVDGLKPSRRKVLHAANGTLKTDNLSKMLHLVGDTLKKSHYSHGDLSLVSAIVNMSSNYKNILAPLTIDGSNGDLLSQEVAAPRYLDIYLSKFAEMYFIDQDILEYNYDCDIKIEPKYYLPIIPMFLVQRDQGVALGYKYLNDISFHPISVIDVVEKYLKTDKINIKKLQPFVIGFDGTFESVEDDRFISSGKYEIKNNKIIVSCLPLNHTFDSFEKKMNKLIEKGTIIDYVDETSEKGVRYIIHLNKNKLDELQEKGTFENILQLKCKHDKPLLTLLDENEKLLEFGSYKPAIKTFIDFRLTKYDERKTNLVKVLDKKILHNTDVAKFIKLVIDKKIILNNIPILKVKNQLTKHNLPFDVLNVSITKLTKEEYEKLLAEIENLKSEKKYILKTEVKDMYLDDLKELKKKLTKIFK